MIYCPIKTTKKWKEMESALGHDIAGLVYHRNGGNYLDYDLDGKKSELFKNLLEKFDGDRSKALKTKASIYSSIYLAKDNWIENGAEPNIGDLFTKANDVLKSTPVKEGVDFVFEQNPELSNIGTQGEYSEYLNNIFPNSEVKDVVYHGSNQKINQFEIRKEPLIHFGSKNAALQRGDVLNQVLLNVKDLQTIKDGMWFLGTDEGGLLKELLDRNILTIEEVRSINEVRNKAIEQSHYFHEDYRMAIPEGTIAGAKKLQEILKNRNIGFEYINLSEDKGSTSYAIPSPEQIHILSSKKDLEMFKNFINFTKSEYAKYGNIQQFRDYIMSKNFAAVEEFLVVNNKIDRKC